MTDPRQDELADAEIASMLRSYEGPPLAQPAPASRRAWRRLRPAAVAAVVLVLAAGASVAVYLVERGPGREAAIGTPPCLRSFSLDNVRYVASGVAAQDVPRAGVHAVVSTTCEVQPVIEVARIRGVPPSVALAHGDGVVYVARDRCARETAASALLRCLES